MKRVSLVGIIFVVVFFVGCGRQGKERQYSGTLELTEHSLGAKVAGRLTTLTVEEGSIVKVGQLIGTLDRYEQAQKDYDRQTKLLASGGSTQQQLEYAALALDDQRIVSPIDGVVLVKVREVGETLSSGSAVVVIGDRKDLWVKIFIPEGEINTIGMNQPATLFFDGLKERFSGHVIYIAPRAEYTPRNIQTQEERVTQTFAVKVRLDNPPAFLRPGVACDVYLRAVRE